MDFDSLYREQRPRALATLIRLLRDFDLAEEALQEAFAVALAQWPQRGVPQNPCAWLVATARHKAIDHLRREKSRAGKQAEAALMSERFSAEPDAAAFPDDLLRLIFTCCHPALALEAQVALTLKTLCGLSVEEIARAFLVPPATMAQRLVRAKGKIRHAGIPYAVPAGDQLAERLDGVLRAVYLVFNEGYSATRGDALVRRELCGEAIRLGRLVGELMPAASEATGLLALMLLQDSRRAARVDARGELVTLEEQDRSLWDRGQISEGQRLAEQALAVGGLGFYALQAAIGSDGLAADRRPLRVAAPAPSFARRRAQPRGGRGNGPAPGARPRVDRGSGIGRAARGLPPAARGQGRHPEAVGTSRRGRGGIRKGVGPGQPRGRAPLPGAAAGRGAFPRAQ